MGYEAIQTLGMPNLDETYGQRGFWRSRHRWAPHNAYTSVAGARDSLQARVSVPEGSWAAFTFKDPSTPYTDRPAPGISIEYQPWKYRVEYRHDEASNRYARFTAGAPHVDAESGDQLFAANVAVLRVDAWVIDSAGRLDMALVGGGAAVYLVDGAAIEGAWKKDSETAPMQLIDSAGRLVRFNPGPIWVQLVHPDTEVSF